MLEGSLRTYQYRYYPDKEELCRFILDDFGKDTHTEELADVLDDYWNGKRKVFQTG